MVNVTITKEIELDEDDIKEALSHVDLEDILKDVEVEDAIAALGGEETVLDKINVLDAVQYYGNLNSKDEADYILECYDDKELIDYLHKYGNDGPYIITNKEPEVDKMKVELVKYLQWALYVIGDHIPKDKITYTDFEDARTKLKEFKEKMKLV